MEQQEQYETERESYVVQALWPSGKWRKCWPRGEHRTQAEAEEFIAERRAKRARTEELDLATEAKPKRYRIEHQHRTTVHTVVQDVEA